MKIINFIKNILEEFSVNGTIKENILENDDYTIYIFCILRKDSFKHSYVANNKHFPEISFLISEIISSMVSKNIRIPKGLWLSVRKNVRADIKSGSKKMFRPAYKVPKHMEYTISLASKKDRGWPGPFLKIGSKIGQGTFGKVYNGVFLNKKVAIKVSSPCEDRGKEMTTVALREIHALTQLKHENIISLTAYNYDISTGKYILLCPKWK